MPTSRTTLDFVGPFPTTVDTSGSVVTLILSSLPLAAQRLGDANPQLEALRRGGRYVTSGAIAGPIVELDVRTLYLKDLTLIGCTIIDETVFGRLVRRIQNGEVSPLVSRTFPLEEIAEAQTEFVSRRHVGKIVLTVGER